MPVFATPQPIIVNVEVGGGDVRLIAGDRTDTSVEVRPGNRARSSDVRAAELTRVQYANGRLLIKGPKPRFGFGKRDSIEVTIQLPAGSTVHGSIAMGELRVEGRIGECRFHTAMGDFHLEQAGPVNLSTEYGSITVDQVAGDADISTGYGSVTVDRVEGHANVSTGSGTMRIRKIGGKATIKNSDGNTQIGEVTGELRFNGACGDISVDRARASVTAMTAYGNARIGDVVRGSILLETAYGALEVGIHEGTAAWIDVIAKHGKVRNSLKADDGPRESDKTVEVRARTAYGNVTIHRST